MKKKLKVIVKGEVKEVTLGYFRNYLLPNRMAEIATEELLQNLEEQKTREIEERKQRITDSEAKTEKLKDITLTFAKRAAKMKGKIFGSVTTKQIEDALKKEGIENASVLLEKPIKELGEHKIEIDFGSNVKGKVLIKIEEEK